VDSVEAVVIGAGVIGLAIARELAVSGRDTLILEADRRFGTGVSSRNSEVIHAGIYYRQASLKARLCVAGRDQLYAWCRDRGVPHQRCGKLIVATDPTQLPALEALAGVARGNGVVLDILPGAAAIALEPQLACLGALHSPLSGIIDSHAYMLSLLADAERHGAMLACDSSVTRVVLGEGSIAIGVNGAEPSLEARLLFNCAGVDAPATARRFEGFPAAQIPTEYFSRGNYFSLSGRAPFRHLIYPLPEPGGLGIHLTLDLAGKARFGPDVEWIESRDYQVNPQRGARFYQAIRRYWPALQDGALHPDYAGVRPKITGPGEPDADFRIDGPRAHGVAGVVNLFGIESPGLTASLALASEAVSRIE
jgi:L-2-hydroxyglutarate oxidase LhgO